MAKKVSKGVIACLAVAGFIVGAGGGFAVSYVLNNAEPELPDSYVIPVKETPSAAESSSAVTEVLTDATVNTIKANDISFHFMELGNKYTGDSVLVKSGDVEVLIDGGSKASSVDTVVSYCSKYIEGNLDYVIVTHAHEDHYAGFATSKYADSLFSKLNVGSGTTIIDFAKITKNKASNNMYKYYQSNLATAVSNGATHYNAEEALSAVDEDAKLNNGVISLSSSVTMKILDSLYYHQVSTTENNHSVCTLFTCGSLNYLLTGDLEKDGEDWIAEHDDLPECELYKAGHHGSKTSSNEKLMARIKPKKICVCCCAGSSEYTKTDANQFPTQDFVNRVGIYTDKIYVTSHCLDYDKGEFESMNGNIVITNNKDASEATVYCSKNTILLKDTEWFKAHRTWPESN